MLRKIRIALATIFFAGITLLFLDFTGTLHHYLSWMAKLQFLPAVLSLNVVVLVILLLLTLVFGRIYCSVICPLGVMQDLMASVRRKKNRYSYSPAVSWLRYLMLAVMVVAVAAGIGSLVALLAPYSSFGRIATHLLQPLYMGVNNVLASLAERADSYAFYSVDVWLRTLPTLIIAAVTFVVLFILAWRNGRTYCNTICPVGTVLGFVARFSWLKVRFDADKCRNCSLCSKNCKASCIDYKTHTVDYSRCVACGNCVEKCKFGALHYAPATKKATSEAQPSDLPDKSKRTFLLTTALAGTALMAQEKKKVDGQLCVAQCPNQVLRPATDLTHMMQPVMSYERGYCRPECTRCSEVCPTGAIKPITPEVKSSTQMGHAVWIKKNCIPLTDGVECGNCARHCPVGAIEMVPSDPDDDASAYVPAVNESRCIGCGACENLCPARPFPAIYVEGHEVHKEV